MSVTISGLDHIKPTEVLYANPRAIDVLARMIVADMVESSIDLICDGGPIEYPTREAIEDCLVGAPEMGIDMLDDMINGLRDALVKRLTEAQIRPRVKSIQFDEKGYSDIEVDIEID